MADLASILANAPMLNVQQAANAPFVWAQGGRRVTPDEIARQRLIAEQQTAGDYSPVGHWTQGLGRVLDGLEGGFAKRNLRRAEETNAAESNAVLEALLSGNRDEASLLRAAANPYITPELRSMAGGMMPKAWEPNNDFERALAESGVVRGSPDWVKANQMRAAGIADPVIFGQIAGRDFAGPRSWVVEDILGGGDPNISASAGVPSPSPAPSGDIGYADFTGAQRIMQSGGPQALLAAQQGERMPVRVTSKAELDALPSGALVMGPNGEVRRKP